MPTLAESLQGRDLGELRIIAELWGIELEAPDSRLALQRLVPAMLERGLLQEVVEALPEETRGVLDELARRGRQPWAAFTRRYGELREMGAGRRDRERPHLQPVSPVESLWYRGLLARAFFETPAGAEEFAYIPDDLLKLLLPPASTSSAVLGRPAYPAEYSHVILADDRLLDHACTLLAALRLGLTPLPELGMGAGAEKPLPELTTETLRNMLKAAGLLDAAGLPAPEPARVFLEAARGVALAQLAQAWLRSDTFNELHLLPGLSAEGDWMNDPRRTRLAVLDLLAGVAPKTWWSLAAFVSALRQQYPDFQRPAGDYDSWFLRDQQSGEFLRGFEHWDAVDGALLRYLICGPLHWLGILDLARPSPEAAPTAFRFTAWAADLLQGQTPAGLPAEDVTGLQARSDARLFLPRRLQRLARYQVARFCEWEKETPEGYHYRLTPPSLERARKQGLTVGHLLALLRKHAGLVPPSLVRALERWEQHGAQARLEAMVVLRVSAPEVLQALRASRAARFLGEPLSPTAVAVKPGAAQKVLAALAEQGYLGEARLENERS
jgi:hypothetical protein